MAVIEGDKALVRWCGVSGATQYQIKRSTAKTVVIRLWQP